MTCTKIVVDFNFQQNQSRPYQKGQIFKMNFHKQPIMFQTTVRRFSAPKCRSTWKVFQGRTHSGITPMQNKILLMARWFLKMMCVWPDFEAFICKILLYAAFEFINNSRHSASMLDAEYNQIIMKKSPFSAKCDVPGSNQRSPVWQADALTFSHLNR